MRDDGTLRAAATVAAIENTVLIAVVLLRGQGTAAFYATVLAVKYVFCVLVVRRSAGAFLGLLLYEFAGLLGALLAPKVRLELRAVELLLSATTIGLLIASARLFPTTQLPRPER